MRINQIYISKSVADFDVMGFYKVGDYTDSTEPCLFFGMYRHEDLNAVLFHTGLAVIRWCGHDAVTFTEWDLLHFENIHHITPFPEVARILSLKGIRCKLIQNADFRPEYVLKANGPKVYAYCPKSFPDYHGGQILKKLNLTHDLIVGDGSTSQKEWIESKADKTYNQCFIGLFLSNVAGGGSGIIEMGLRGKRVITNVLKMPHTIGWNTISDIEKIIKDEMSAINLANHALSIKVKKNLDSNFNFLYTENYD